MSLVYDTSLNRDRGIVHVCTIVAAAAAVFMYSLRFFPHRDRWLPPLVLLLFMLLFLVFVVAVPPRSRPSALKPRQK